MGISQEFYCGSATAMSVPLNELELEAVRASCSAYADFSLHLSPTDLDILSETIARHAQSAPLLLLDSLVGSVADLGDDGAADLVGKDWVAMVSGLPDADCAAVAADWIQAVGEELGEPLELTEDALNAVRALGALCRQAQAQQLDVVYVWYP